MRNYLIVLVMLPTLLLAVSASAGADSGKVKRAYCYFDRGKLTWRIGNEAIERTIHFDRDTGGLRTLKVECKGPGPRIAPVSGSEGEFILAGQEAPIRLDSDWIYQWQSVGMPLPGVRRLTVHLWGKGRNKGYEAEAVYEAYPGKSPVLAKWLTLINRTGAPQTVQEIVYDRWALVAPSAKKGAAAATPGPLKFESGPGASATLTDPATRVGLAAGVLGAGGEAAYQNSAVVLRCRAPMEMPGEGGRATAPPSLAAAFTGDAPAGQALLQKYAGASHPTAKR
jgi:hypothetical protein